MSTRGWSDAKRRAALTHSNLTHRRGQLEHERALLRKDYSIAMAFGDQVAKKKLSKRYHVLQAEWRKVREQQIAAKEEMSRS